jgi:hypothetical protein
MKDRTAIRIGLALLVFVALGYNSIVWAASETRTSANQYIAEANQPVDERTQVVPPRQNATVVTTRGIQGVRGTNSLYVFGADGRLLYHENRTRYADVDPHPRGAQTLMVAADDPAPTGTTQRIRLVNYSTGTTTDALTVRTPSDRDSNWHDVDRVGPHRYAIAGIYGDRAYTINTSTRVTTWSWRMQYAYNVSSGGPYPDDWAHLNDIEQLPDGRYMLSPRNHDQVLFVDPETGLQANWTLGCDDCFNTLFEQHNPDYIPASRGGPAVLIADSENNRIVEYQRVNDSWEQSWVWQDSRMNWPRDADRLPNGHTLITDTHENRVFEVDRGGEIVWSIAIPNGYEAERLGTGDESAGGPSAVRANLTSVGGDTTANASSYELANEGERGMWTQKLKHGILFTMPPWVGVWNLLFGIIGALAVVARVAAALYWRGVRVRSPVTRLGGWR